jgi:hypothetical protein
LTRDDADELWQDVLRFMSLAFRLGRQLFQIDNRHYDVNALVRERRDQFPQRPRAPVKVPWTAVQLRILANLERMSLIGRHLGRCSRRVGMSFAWAK